MNNSLDKSRGNPGDEPANGESWLEYARHLLYETGEAVQALAALETAQRLLPGKDLRHHIGTALFKIGERVRGLDLLMDYLRDSSSATDYIIVYYECYDVGDLERAKDVLEQAVTNGFGENSKILGELGRVSFDLHEVNTSIDYYRKSLERDSENDFAWRGLGVSLSRSAFSAEDLEGERRIRAESLKALKRAVRLAPDDPDSAFSLAISLWMNGHNKLANSNFQTAMKLDPSNQSFIYEYRKFIIDVET